MFNQLSNLSFYTSPQKKGHFSFKVAWIVSHGDAMCFTWSKDRISNIITNFVFRLASGVL